MKLSNGIISIEIANHGAELKSAVKDGFEYMWCADEKYWARTSPVLFPIVGSLNNKLCKIGGKVYEMSQHGFARDNGFELVDSSEASATYEFCANEETLKKYPFDFSLKIKYTLIENKIKVEWYVENKDNKAMCFQIGAHPAFNLKDGDNFFKFDTDSDITYNLINGSGLYDKNSVHTLKNDGYVKITNDMFDNDALIIENCQAKEVCICTADRKPYVKVKFDAPLFGLWSPAKKNAPFVCIEPWWGRCDSIGFDGEFEEREYVNFVEPNETFAVGYEIEFV
ncbi:MAG: aldose 1-epimerase family protein [Ruminococcaceae bacterium]|nr:aldose 1-epimerase family protein [Oscillospiraceae bacterium]